MIINNWNNKYNSKTIDFKYHKILIIKFIKIYFNIFPFNITPITQKKKEKKKKKY